LAKVAGGLGGSGTVEIGPCRLSIVDALVVDPGVGREVILDGRGFVAALVGAAVLGFGEGTVFAASLFAVVDVDGARE
jgi:hypothetical protein